MQIAIFSKYWINYQLNNKMCDMIMTNNGEKFDILLMTFYFYPISSLKL